MRHGTTLLLWSFLLTLGTAAGADFLPLEAGNAWELSMPSYPGVLRYNVEWTDGPLSSVRFENPWAPYSMLLLKRSDGIYLEGYTSGSTTYRFNSPSPFLPSGGQPGQVWEGGYATVELLADSVIVSTPSGTFQSCRRYRIRPNSGGEQIWTIAPGTGFVQFGSPDAAFSLSTYSLYPAPLTVAAASANVNCGPVGLASIPQSSTLTTADREAALKVALNAGSKMMVVSAQWSELEPSPGVYNLTRIQSELSLAKKYNLPIAFTLATVWTSVKSLPPDLQTKAWTDAQVNSRFRSLMTKLVPALPANVRWLHLGYEVDTYLSTHSSEMSSFATFVSTSKTAVQQLAPSRTWSIGSVFAYDTTRVSSAAVDLLLPRLDHVAFDYYAIGSDFQQRSLEDVDVDLRMMIRYAGAKPILLTEAGYSSSPKTSSSEEKQQAFFDALFTTVRTKGRRFQGVYVWALNDLPDNMVQQLSAQLGLSGNTAFQSYLGTLGLRNSYGVPKSAWNTFGTWAQQLGQAGSCQQ